MYTSSFQLTSIKIVEHMKKHNMKIPSTNNLLIKELIFLNIFNRRISFRIIVNVHYFFYKSGKVQEINIS